MVCLNAIKKPRAMVRSLIHLIRPGKFLMADVMFGFDLSKSGFQLHTAKSMYTSN